MFRGVSRRTLMLRRGSAKRENVAFFYVFSVLSLSLFRHQYTNSTHTHRYPMEKRVDWILKWPGQIILNVGCLYWTKEVESAIESGTLPELLDRLQAQLNDLILLVRGKLSKQQKISLGALCVIDVHNLEIVRKLTEEKVSRKEAFTWNSQLRYYYVHNPDDYDRFGDDPMNLVARIVNAQQLYCYEYLGNSSRLVITPLTDRCYRTMMGAVSLMYGGAPAGPAGA